MKTKAPAPIRPADWEADLRSFPMAFGQSSGPPASGKDVAELLRLLQEAGHQDFRDARGTMGFSQRQAGGKFTRDEISAFIEQLQDEADAAVGQDPTEPPPREVVRASAPAKVRAPVPAAPSDKATSLRSVSTELLAAELQRRGWVVMEP